MGISDPVLTTPEFLGSETPVYIVGSGKTAMDFVRHLGQGTSPRRPVHEITGSGMWFFVRDTLYPTGTRRHFGGMLAADGFLRIALDFDGQNEATLVAGLEREGRMMKVFDPSANCRYGLLSIAERDEILARVGEVHRGHLVDVEGTRMILRVGKDRREVPVAEGSWIVNCTSHLREAPHEPLEQDGGAVCAPQFAMGFSGTSAYFLTHLWYRGELPAVASELFRIRLDVEPKLRFVPNLGLMVMANMALAGAHLPLSVQGDFQGDFNKWYPFYRQLPAVTRVMRSRREVIRRAERFLKLRFADPPDPRAG